MGDRLNLPGKLFLLEHNVTHIRNNKQIIKDLMYFYTDWIEYEMYVLQKLIIRGYVDWLRSLRFIS